MAVESPKVGDRQHHTGEPIMQNAIFASPMGRWGGNVNTEHKKIYVNRNLAIAARIRGTQ
jgi:hypothetical protein